MRKFFKEYQFIITVILGLVGIIGLDALFSFLTKTIHIIPWMNALLGRYSGILLLILILINLYLVRKQTTISKIVRKLSPKTLAIVSDEKTVFIGSNTNKGLPSNVKTVPAQIHPLWKGADNKYPELGRAIWIADRNIITNDEAIHGGQYTFVREFEIPFELDQILSAEILLLVDDYCELIVNGNRFDKVEGFHNLNRFDIGPKLQKNINRVQFVIENRNSEAENNPNVNKGFYDAREKYLWNPYGFKYSIIIQYLG